jgi:hypothetical protein
VEDRRETIARQSQQNRARRFPDGWLPPKHGWNGQTPLRPDDSKPWETPGGVGHGYYFNNGSLLWTNSTVADYYVVTPTVLGGYVSTLYLTSTCRSQLGTESLIYYGDENEAQFWIFDWSQAPASPWQAGIDLPSDNPQYLATRPDEFAVARQMVHVRNGTWYLGYSGGQYNWENQVMLFDFIRGDWDLVYSHNYSSANLTNNIPTAGGDPVGFWGPIVETFDTYTNVNPVGFDLIRLFQDGDASPFWLTPGNSYALQSSPWNLLTEAPNTSFTVAVGSSYQNGGPYNLGTLCVTANTNAASFSISPPAGLVSPYWIMTPYSNRWDNVVVGLSPGVYTISFNAVPGLVTPAGQVFQIASNSISTVRATYQAPVAGPPFLSPNLPPEVCALAGGTAVFSVGVSGSYPFTQQWFSNGVPLPAGGRVSGATNDTLMIANVQPGDAATYQVIVTNALGHTPSTATTLVVENEPAFNGNGAGWSLTNGLGGVAGFVGNNLLQLTAATTPESSQVAGIWFNNPVYIGGFQTHFTYADAGAFPVGDGIAFVIQNSPEGTNALGDGGGALGMDGITPSVAFEMSLYGVVNQWNSGYGWGTNGASLENNQTPEFFLAENPGGQGATYAGTDGETKDIWLAYDGSGVMAITVSNETTFNVGGTNLEVGNLQTLLGTNVAYIGFTGTTGGYDATQTIGSFTYLPLVSLAASLSGNNVVLTWPAGTGGYELQYSTVMPGGQGAGGWTTVPATSYNIVHGVFQVSLPARSVSTFYRLYNPI